mmetsp:Transcript_22673/g.56017  ORF Transcript_22673/g.56017 Transcript_22673/m.56017 type:complete len:83 (-) Transcript_22673:159-407(-)|eukprot:CAMPEP_0113631382 /NCGR_PEP_ID=MMETSP0017_2-20120614/16308_1 /TAXON_ID=2856 /ORGANISM="Cylindrotheca closterium" /LENGTH=82 /DNA_ID=CAMNT_0000541889 /DNA_START=71 /DNA_END=319 /DNA_ORIENTATION=+ /assembly_acc=CAM_ASM_000147
MGNGASNAIGQAVAKQKMKGALDDAKQGAESNKETEAQKQRRKENEAKAKQRIAEFEQKKKAREERKKKLKGQWGAHRKANS